MLKLEIFVDELLNQHWEYIYFFGDDPNAMCMGNMERSFLEVIHKHTPIQHKKTKSSKVPWITNKIKGVTNTRQTKRQTKKKSNTKLETDCSNYKIVKNQVNIELRNAKKNYYSYSKISDQKYNQRKHGSQLITCWATKQTFKSKRTQIRRKYFKQSKRHCRGL